MAAPTPLIPEYDMVMVPPTVPDGELPALLIPGLPGAWPAQVNLTLSSGENVYVGTVTALLQLVTLMLRKGQHVIYPSEDVFIALAGPGAKIIVGEMTFQNQKLLSSGCFVYVQGRMEVWARNGSCIYTLDEALQCVGRYRTSALPYENTADLVFPTGVHSPRLLVIDLTYTPAMPQLVEFIDDPPRNYSVRR